MSWFKSGDEVANVRVLSRGPTYKKQKTLAVVTLRRYEVVCLSCGTEFGINHDGLLNRIARNQETCKGCRAYRRPEEGDNPPTVSYRSVVVLYRVPAVSQIS